MIEFLIAANIFAAVFNFLWFRRLEALRKFRSHWSFLMVLIADHRERKQLELLTYSQLLDLERIFNEEFKRRGFMKPRF